MGGGVLLIFFETFKMKSKRNSQKKVQKEICQGKQFPISIPWDTMVALFLRC
jgi:hypothetical protein